MRSTGVLFYRHGAPQRTERHYPARHHDADPQRSSLQDAADWSEWCITEDAELGLRIFETGYDAVYIPRVFGQGLMPDTFIV